MEVKTEYVVTFQEKGHDNYEQEKYDLNSEGITSTKNSDIVNDIKNIYDRWNQIEGTYQRKIIYIQKKTITIKTELLFEDKK